MKDTIPYDKWVHLGRPILPGGWVAVDSPAQADEVHERFQEARNVRTFETGATRDTDEGKLDYEGFFSPLVLKRRAEYMHHHRVQADGSLRASDNWQKGIPREQYMKSAFRHFMEWWTDHRREANGRPTVDSSELEDAICALMFNCEGYLHELLRDEQ